MQGPSRAAAAGAHLGARRRRHPRRLRAARPARPRRRPQPRAQQPRSPAPPAAPSAAATAASPARPSGAAAARPRGRPQASPAWCAAAGVARRQPTASLSRLTRGGRTRYDLTQERWRPCASSRACAGRCRCRLAPGPDLGALDEHAPPQRVLRAQRLVHLVQPRHLPAAPAARVAGARAMRSDQASHSAAASALALIPNKEDKACQHARMPSPAANGGLW